MVRIASKLLNRLEKWILKESYPLIDLHFQDPKNKEVKNRLRFIFQVLFSSSSKSPSIIFFVNSAADLRVISPLLAKVDQGYIVTCCQPTFYKNLEKLTDNISTSILPLIKGLKSKKKIKFVTALCYPNQPTHRFGSILIDAFNKTHETYCLQHGGTKQDNLDSMSTVNASKLLVWGQFAKNYILAKTPNKQVFVTGNPLHNNLKFENREPNPKTILLATCIHTEYDNHPNSENLYTSFLNDIYAVCDQLKMNLIVKKHPIDPKGDETLYHFIHKNYSFPISIQEADSEPNIYDLFKQSNAVITRASTVGEEALLFNKRIIFYDVVESGPSKYYGHLSKFAQVSFCRSQAQLIENLTIEQKLQFNKGVIDELSYDHMNATDNIIALLKN